MRAGFDLTGDEARALALREDACEALLPCIEAPRKTLEDLNDSSIGYATVTGVFEMYMERA